MKGLNKLALAAAISAAPFAQAELTAMDDSALQSMTGQAGVSIELSTQVSVGSFTYTDTDGYDADGAGPDTGSAGSIAMNGITFGGAGAVNGFADADLDNALDGIKIDIDVDGSKGLLIHLGATNANDALTGAEVIDFGLAMGTVDMNGTTLASNIAIAGALGPIDIAIDNAGTIDVGAFFKVTSGAMDIDVISMGVSNLVIDQDSNPFMNVSPYGTKVNTLVGAGDFAAANDGIPATGTPLGDLSALDGDTSGTISAAEWNAAGITTVASADTVLAGGSGAIIENARQSAGLTGFDDYAYVAMNISSGTGTFQTTAGTLVDTQSLDITISSMSMDITADLTLGAQDVGQTGTFTAASLGSIAIEDLDLSGTTLKIYGH